MPSSPANVASTVRVPSSTCCGVPTASTPWGSRPRSGKRIGSGPRIALHDHAVAVGDRDRAAGLVARELRDGGEPGLDDRVAVGGGHERAARPAERALAGERPVVAGGGAHERVEHDPAEDQERQLDERHGRAARAQEHAGRARERGEIADGVEPAAGARQVRGVLGHRYVR